MPRLWRRLLSGGIALGPAIRPSFHFRSCAAARDGHVAFGALLLAIILAGAAFRRGTPEEEAYRRSGEVESQAIAAWGEIVDDARRGQITDNERLAERIQQEVLFIWSQASVPLAELDSPVPDEIALATLREYHAMRGEAWAHLIATLRTDEPDQRRRYWETWGRAEQLAAELDRDPVRALPRLVKSGSRGR